MTCEKMMSRRRIWMDNPSDWFLLLLISAIPSPCEEAMWYFGWKLGRTILGRITRPVNVALFSSYSFTVTDNLVKERFLWSGNGQGLEAESSSFVIRRVWDVLNTEGCGSCYRDGNWDYDFEDDKAKSLTVAPCKIFKLDFLVWIFRRVLLWTVILRYFYQKIDCLQ